MKDLVILARREFWEHRSLWIAPLVASGVLVVLTIIGTSMARVHLDADRIAGPAISGHPRAAMAALALSTQIFLVATIAAVGYLLDSLYAERKDRSILFWKSLPVSDAKTVLVKYGVAMLLVPLGVYVLAAASTLLIHGIVQLLGPEVMARLGGGTGSLLRAQAQMLGVVLVTMLWYAPLAAWLMLASVLARRSPWLIVALVPVGLFLAESVLFRTRYVLTFVGDRLSPALDSLETLQRPALWLGLVAAAGMLYIVIRLRRYRDDT
jgi:ABC-2 type transport system permease protein